MELTTARRLQKPLIVVRETDVRYGGLSAWAFEAEVKLHVARHLSGMNEDEQAALAWLQSAAIDGACAFGPLGFQALLRPVPFAAARSGMLPPSPSKPATMYCPFIPPIVAS